MGPAAVGLAATQINLLVSTVIASLLVQGSVSWLAYAFRLMQLPLGVFGVAVAGSNPWNWTALNDQRRGGLIMWMGGGASYAALMFVWLLKLVRLG